MKGKQKPIKFIVKEQQSGTKNIGDIFADIFLSEMKENLWTLEQKGGIMEPPTIPNQIVPNERS